MPLAEVRLGPLRRLLVDRSYNSPHQSVSLPPPELISPSSDRHRDNTSRLGPTEAETSSQTASGTPMPVKESPFRPLRPEFTFPLAAEVMDDRRLGEG